MPVLVGGDMTKTEFNLKSRLEEALTRELSDLPVKREARCGDPAVKITEFADSNGVDLIMTPTHGCGPQPTDSAQ